LWDLEEAMIWRQVGVAKTLVRMLGLLPPGGEMGVGVEMLVVEMPQGVGVMPLAGVGVMPLAGVGVMPLAGVGVMPLAGVGASLGEEEMGRVRRSACN